MSLKADSLLLGAVALGAWYLLRSVVNSPAVAAVGAAGAAAAAAAQATGDAIGGFAYDAMNPQAGLGPGEYSPAPGIIVNTVGSQALDEVTALTWPYSVTPAGAVTGRVLKP